MDVTTPNLRGRNEVLGSCKKFFRHRAAHGQRNQINVEGGDQEPPELSGLFRYGVILPLEEREDPQTPEESTAEKKRTSNDWFLSVLISFRFTRIDFSL